ncbi:FAD-binding domain-containing protein [Aspergillus egyptiacus]|nr:FAD-binding domain-containing protein [Aspergillus egyptiacus]
MKLRLAVSLLFTLSTLRLAAACGATDNWPDVVAGELGPQLSPSASLATDYSGFERWSAYRAPQPGVVVSVATETDVARTVAYCVSNSIQFLAQNGGHGWADTFDLGPNGRGLLIDLTQLNSVVFNDDRTQVTLGGGASIGEVVAAAVEHDALVPTGNCNCVGTLGAILGGGYGILQGMAGFGVDNVLVMNVVLADGELHTVTPGDEDLFWALRGAGPNYGIVTSATLKSYPVATAANVTAWMGTLVFSGDQVEAVVQAVDQLHLTPEMNIFLYYARENGTPGLVAAPFYYDHGSEPEARGREAFASLLAIGPVQDQTAELPYARWNDRSEAFCTGGGYKPAYSAALGRLEPGTWKRMWDEYVAFTETEGTANSVVLMEAYSLERSRSLPDDSSAFPWRSRVNFQAIAIPWYYDPVLEGQATAWAKRMRAWLWETGGLHDAAAYVNFAHGDEDLTTIYGENVDRLRAIKARVDPGNVFNQWFNLV